MTATHLQAFVCLIASVEMWTPPQRSSQHSLKRHGDHDYVQNVERRLRTMSIDVLTRTEWRQARQRLEGNIARLDDMHALDLPNIKLVLQAVFDDACKLAPKKGRPGTNSRDACDLEMLESLVPIWAAHKDRTSMLVERVNCLDHLQSCINNPPILTGTPMLDLPTLTVFVPGARTALRSLLAGSNSSKITVPREANDIIDAAQACIHTLLDSHSTNMHRALLANAEMQDTLFATLGLLNSALCLFPRASGAYARQSSWIIEMTGWYLTTTLPKIHSLFPASPPTKNMHNFSFATTDSPVHVNAGSSETRVFAAFEQLIAVLKGVPLTRELKLRGGSFSTVSSSHSLVAGVSRNSPTISRQGSGLFTTVAQIGSITNIQDSDHNVSDFPMHALNTTGITAMARYIHPLVELGLLLCEAAGTPRPLRPSLELFLKKLAARYVIASARIVLSPVPAKSGSSIGCEQGDSESIAGIRARLDALKAFCGDDGDDEDEDE